MAGRHTLGELNNLSREELITIILGMQGQLDALNENIEKLIEQVHMANQYRFGRRTETMESIDGQLSFFDEADALYNPLVQEPDIDDVLPRKVKKKKAKGQREEDLKDFPEDIIPTHTVSREALDAFYGERQMPSDTYKRLRHEPESWTVEVHTVDVFVGTDGEHQDEFMRVHRSGEFYTERPIVVYEYQKGRNHELPRVFYQDYEGILVTDGLSWYHLIEKKLLGLTNANCWVHARRDYG